GYDAVNIARALDLAAGRDLAPLPPEAFELRRDRSKVAPVGDDVAPAGDDVARAGDDAAPTGEEPALDAAGSRA
ncbi:MAG TPA: hypothetical protein VFV72_08140, partial [Candidatus Limnocylindrales bacterium]|nr:hypothetical protein [Candidatus Limnocylindrales bacterium]